MTLRPPPDLPPEAPDALQPPGRGPGGPQPAGARPGRADRDRARVLRHVRARDDRHSQCAEALKRYYEEFLELHGARPRAVEAFHEGYNPRAARAAHGSWLGFVASQGGLGTRAEACLRAPPVLPRRARRHAHEEELQDARPPPSPSWWRPSRPATSASWPTSDRRAPPRNASSATWTEPDRGPGRRKRHRRDALLRQRERRLPHDVRDGTRRPGRLPGARARTPSGAYPRRSYPGGGLHSAITLGTPEVYAPRDDFGESELSLGCRKASRPDDGLSTPDRERRLPRATGARGRSHPATLTNTQPFPRSKTGFLMRGNDARMTRPRMP
jgi:hypothetical protein